MDKHHWDSVMVTAAIIKSKEGFLITKKKGGPWEFPGGKIELGETAEQTLIREIREELGCEISVGSLFGTSSTRGKNGVKYIISFYNCRIKSGSPKPSEHEGMRWVKKTELRNYEFSEGDAAIVGRMTDPFLTCCI